MDEETARTIEAMKRDWFGVFNYYCWCCGAWVKINDVCELTEAERSPRTDKCLLEAWYASQ